VAAGVLDSRVRSARARRLRHPERNASNRLVRLSPCFFLCRKGAPRFDRTRRPAAGADLNHGAGIFEIASSMRPRVHEPALPSPSISESGQLRGGRPLRPTIRRGFAISSEPEAGENDARGTMNDETGPPREACSSFSSFLVHRFKSSEVVSPPDPKHLPAGQQVSGKPRMVLVGMPCRGRLLPKRDSRIGAPGGTNRQVVS